MITDAFVFDFLPKLKAEVSRFADEAYSKQRMSEEISAICNAPIAVQVGHLKIAKPVNDLIDSLVKEYGEKTKAA